MTLHFFQCPGCGEDFSCSHTEKSDRISCPKCGLEQARKDFRQLFFCPECEKVFRVKLLDEKTVKLSCPHCERSFSLEQAFNPKTRGEKSFLSGKNAALQIPEKPADLLKKGDILDKYRIIELLGKGGMAEVYLAEHILLGNFYALKCLLPDSATTTVGKSMVRKRFIREAKLTHHLTHPNIVSIYDVGCDEARGIPFIVMEYVKGAPLSKWAKAPLSEQELFQIANQMAKALELLEKHNIIHRDIKPSNIMRSQDGVIKLMDLGIAKSIEFLQAGSGYPLTAENTVFGTPAYASPEQCKDSGRIDCRSDIYSLGATLYHLATGKAPHSGTTPVAVIHQVIEKDPEPLALLRPDLSGKLRQLIECMMAKDPDDRPGNALQLQKKLHKAEGKTFVSDMTLFRGHKVRIAGLAALLLLLLSLFYFFFPLSRQTDREIFREQAKSPSPSAVLPQKVLPFRETDFRKKGEKRTLSNRLAETGRILAFLEAPGNRTEFHKQRQEMYKKRERLLTELLHEKNTRKKRFRTYTISPERRESIARYIRSRRHPFRAAGKDGSFGLQLLADVSNGQLDPDTEFVNNWNVKCTLLYHAFSGILLPSPYLLRGLLEEGADIDRTPERFPFSLRKRDMAFFFNNPRTSPAELLIRAGKDEVDYFLGYPVLPGCFIQGNINSHGQIVTYSCNWALAEFLVDSACLTEITDDSGKTIAHHAAAWDQAEILEKLLLSGSPLFTTGDNAGLTPWHYALRNDARKAIALLEKFRIPVPVFTPQDHAQRDLLRALQTNDPTLAEKALRNGADPGFIYAKGLNALQNAVWLNCYEIMELLLKHKADIRANESNMSPLEIAIRTRRPKFFKRLLQEWTPPGFLITSNGSREYLPYRIVCSCHMDPGAAKAMLETLLSRNWRINDPAPGGELTVLHTALTHSNLHKDILQYLLEKGADPYRKTPDGKNAFQIVKNPGLRAVLEKSKRKGK